jgi:hypothetical protein
MRRTVYYSTGIWVGLVLGRLLDVLLEIVLGCNVNRGYLCGALGCARAVVGAGRVSTLGQAWLI